MKETLCALFWGGLLVALIVLCVHSENVYRRVHSCVATGQWRDEMVMLPMMIGDTTTLMPQWIRYYEFQCDNGLQWR